LANPVSEKDKTGCAEPGFAVSPIGIGSAAELTAALQVKKPAQSRRQSLRYVNRAAFGNRFAAKQGLFIT
jgi:hypothetical protein